MPQPFSLTSGNSPFVPHSIALAKKKARELQTLIPELTLSRAQQVVARAFGWSDWFSLGQAISHDYPRSLPDEELEDVEVIRRFQNQKRVLREENVTADNYDHVLASLSLTRSPIAVYARRITGPWGAFDETPEEVFPGVVRGTCAGNPCYYLTPPRVAEMEPPIQLETHGWYPQEKHEWRIIFSFPLYHTTAQRRTVRKNFALNDPFLFELSSETTLPFSLSFGPSMVDRRKAAQAHPDSWFALCVRRFKLFGEDTETANTPTDNASQPYVAGAVRGSTLLQLMASGGVWPKHNPPESTWFGLEQSEILALKMSDSRISGRRGWALPRIAERPFVQSPFERGELVPGNTTLPGHILAHPVMGEPVVID
jgi:hypothetical protein